MAKHEHLLIWQAVYKLTLLIYNVTHQFPREHKYDLGARLKNIVSDLLNLITAANSLPNKTETLLLAQLKMEQLKIHVRLANDLKILSLKQYEFLANQNEEAAKQLSGWLDWSRRQKLSPDKPEY